MTLRRLLLALPLPLLFACAEAPPAPIAATGSPSGPVSSSAPQASAPADSLAAMIAEGQMLNALGDQSGAEAAFRRALEQLESRGGTESPQLVPVLLQLAMVVSLQRRIGEAETEFARAERLIARSPDPWDPPRLNSYRAVHLAQQNRLDDAAKLARGATLVRRDLLKGAAGRGTGRADLSAGLAELAHGLLVEGVIALRLGKLDVADLSANLARRILVDLGAVPEWWIAEVDELVGLIEAEHKRFGSARERVGVALATRQAAFGNRRPVAMSFLSLGRLSLRAGDEGRAMGDMRRGLEILRGDAVGGSALSFPRLADFLLAADAARKSEPGNADRLADEMFQASQMATRSVTARSISLTVARLAATGAGGGVQVAALQKAVLQRDALRLALGREAARPPEERDAGKIDSLRRAVQAASAETDRLAADLDRTAPRLAGLLDPAPISLAALGAQLAPDEAVLSYAVGPEGAWAFAVRRDGVTVARLETRQADLEARVRKLRTALEPGPGGAIAAFDLAAAHELYRLIIAPLAERLAGVAHLVVVPDGPLQSLPFAVLVAEPPPAGRGAYGAAAWLGRNMALSSAPSVRAFADLRRLAQPSKAQGTLLGVADPGLSGRRGAGTAPLARTCRDGRPVPADLLRALQPLPDTAAELRQVAGSLGGSEALLIGAAASEPRLRALPLDRYRVLYFATHGLLPGELDCQNEPGLVLTPPAVTASTHEADGLLAASEIATLTLDADLVVLSACNTAGASGEFGGEALSGLARAFFHAGARSLLVSHWQVDSRATAGLMTGAFAGAGANIGMAERLRRSQRALAGRAETAHPFFWGAFVLIGDGRGAIRLGS